MVGIKKSEMYQRIRAARKRAGLTQQDVAAELEIDRTAVTQWEARNPERRTRPSLRHIEHLAELTRTPIDWFLSDEVDVLDPWPELTRPGPTRVGPFVRAFWEDVKLRTHRIRPDLWGDEVWNPHGPDWLKPLIPDVVTERCAVRWVDLPRVDVARIAGLATSLLGFEQLRGRPLERKAVMVWRPNDPSAEPLSPQEQTYLHDVERISEKAHLLCERLGIRYIEVDHAPGAAHYLAQLL